MAKHQRRVRRAQPEDAPAIAAIWHVGWHDGHVGHVPAELVAVRDAESFRTRAAERIADTTVAEVEGEVAGFVMVVGEEVEQVYVAGRHRGSGVADLLLDNAERQIRRGGHAAGWLAVAPGNARARHFYERNGWIDAGAFDYAAATAHGHVLVPCHRYVKHLSGGPSAGADLHVDEVAQALDLPAETVDWLARIDRPAESPGPELPADTEAEALLERLDVDPVDRASTIAARPDPQEHPALWWVLDRAYHELLATMGACVPIQGWRGYPGLPAATGPVGMHLPVWTYLAVLPAVRDYHASRGIPDDVSWHSLADALGRALRAHRESTGVAGLALWGFGWTLSLRFRGADYQLGQLGFNRGAISLSNGTCGYALAVHIPGGRPLDPAACDESLARAREFFPRHFPEEPVAFFTCDSWLMDPQLAEYLPDGSNIVRFQQRFQTLELPSEETKKTDGDRAVEAYVFGRSYDSLDAYPQDTTLQAAYVAHRRAGRHWHSRTGWFVF